MTLPRPGHPFLGACLLLGACTSPVTQTTDAAQTVDAPGADVVTGPDAPSDGAPFDRSTDAAAPDATADAPDDADARVPDDVPPRDAALDDGPAVDGEARDALADRASPTCVVGRFEATPARHALPGGYPTRAFPGAGSLGSCSGVSGVPGYALYDMNADQRPDLVVTRVCDDATVGSDHWRVYLNGGSSFAGSPTRFALPGGYPTRAFPDAGSLGSCSGASGVPGYALYDMNADQRPDLVVTRVCDDNAVGSDHWRVYLSTGSSFASSPTRFALPGGYPARAFPGAGSLGSCSGASGVPGYALYDMNVDQRPDLVVTRVCDDDAVGSDHWRVYLNSGSAFAGTATRFALPSGYPTRAFPGAGSLGSCSGASGVPGYALYDMNVDQRPDLVVTRVCEDNAVGSDHWRVYLNGGSSFAGSPMRFALPGGYPARAFPGAGSLGSCSGASGVPGYALYDMNVDQRPDLVVTRVCDDDAVGSDHWRVYLNSGSAFAGTATRFALPSGYPTRAFPGAGSLGSCSGASGVPGYALYDMNVDQRPDLVVTRACEDDAVGSDHWRVHLNVCM